MRVLGVLIAGLALHVVMPAAVEAAPRAVLVLPLDGNADPAVRARLNVSVQKLARTIAGEVTVGDATFRETAAAVGCDAAKPACAQTVRVTLGVDELVYGTVTTTSTGTELIVRRVKAKAPARTIRTTIAIEDPPERAETELTPLFDGTGGRDEPIADPIRPTDPRVLGDPVTPRDPVQPVGPEPPGYDNSKRTKGIILASAGGLSVLIGLVLWSSKASVQDQIDSAPTATAADFQRLEDLESRAWRYAIVGDLMVLGGLGVAGYGGWILYQDRQERQVTVTPQLTPTGAGVMVRGAW